MIKVNCYQASIQKTPTGFRIYLFSSYERGGDTEILIKGGDLAVLREKFTIKKGVPMPNGWKAVQISLNGMNWCKKYDHAIDDELVHEICEALHPKGCANCDEIGYKQEVEVS